MLILWLILFCSADLRFEEGDRPGEVEVVAESAPEGARLALYRRGANGHFPIFGKSKRSADRIVLVPAFPLAPGEGYEARLSMGETIVASEDYRVPESLLDPPTVNFILPTAEVVPANLLKFYIEFDQPMRRGQEIFDQVQIIDSEGKAIPAPWRRLDIWSADDRRFTLWIHPGRVKRGIALRESLGPVLEPGRRYTLVLDPSIRATGGKSLGKTVRRQFQVGPPVRERLDASKWEVVAPRSGESKLVLKSDRPLDPFLVDRHLEIRQGSRIIERKLSWDEAQTRFSIGATRGWKSGNHRLIVGGYLEDLAGNTVERVFDRDLSQAEEEGVAREINFEVAP